VAGFGQSTLGLAYALSVAETLVAPAMPSTTARAGGIFMPIIKFLAKAAGSEPDKGRKRLGAYLVQVRSGARASAASAAAAAAATMCFTEGPQMCCLEPQ
jgi:DASS family divalent anion:Na+ symporter